MKTISLLFFISLFINDVFGDKVDEVSVNVGGFVTLHAHADGMNGVYMITWRFNGERIAKFNREVSDTPVYESDERFTDRLKMNPQTGDLTITNITSELTGKYEADIINGVITTKTFSVSLSPKVKKVINKYSVFLHIDVTDEQRKDKIHWRIKHKNSLVAEIITENGEISTPFIVERFRGRVTLNDQTGDVIITNMEEEDSGEFEADVKIGSNTHTIHKTFSYTAPGPSTGPSTALYSGLIAGMVIAAVLLVIAAVVIYRLPIKRPPVSRTEDCL